MHFFVGIFYKQTGIYTSPGSLQSTGNITFFAHIILEKIFFLIYMYYPNMQVMRYLLFCEGGIFSAHAHTLVGTKHTPYMWITL